MDTVFFSGLMLSRWNVKKRHVKYQTDFMAESIYRVLKKRMAEHDTEIAALGELFDVMSLIFLAGAVTNIKTLEHPYADLSGFAK
jgi:hypothetical protein